MDPAVAAQLVVIVILVFLSGFFSSSETALVTINRLKIRGMVDEGIKHASTVSKLVENPSKMLSTILIGNNIVNITLSALATMVTTELWGNQYVGISTGIITLLVLEFGEITPKTMATVKAEKMALAVAPVIYGLSVVLTPVIFVVDKISCFFLFLLRIDPNEKKVVTEEELLTMVDVSHEDGAIESEERAMITNVVDFGDSYAKDVMVPRIDMAFIDVNASYEELMEAFEKDMYSRLPVFEDTMDNVIGIINLKDVTFYKGSKEDFKIRDLLREPYFTYEFKKTSQLLRELKKATNPMAIILDEYGATAGLVTMEDLLEEIVGEIRDEYDVDEEDNIKKISDNEYEVRGGTNLNDLEELIGIQVDTEEYDSIAGHVISLMEHLPKRGEEITDGKFTFKVVKMNKNRVDKVRIVIAPDAQNEIQEEP